MSKKTYYVEALTVHAGQDTFGNPATRSVSPPSTRRLW